MFNRLIHTLKILALAACALHAHHASAVSLALSDSGCSSFTSSTVLGNVMMTCNPSPVPPTCTVDANPAALTAAGSVTLTASCSPGPITAYTWTGDSTVASATTNAVNTIVSATTTYTVKASNSTGTGAPASVTVSVGPPSSPPNCTLTATPNLIQSGSSATLRVSCVPAATSYAWSLNTGFASTAIGGTVFPTTTTTYSVVGSNALGAGNTASATVSVTGMVDLCAQQGLQNSVLEFDWGSGYLKQFPLARNQSYSFILPIPPGGGSGRIQTVYGGNPKLLSISTAKCDFSEALESTNCLRAAGDPEILYRSGQTYLCQVQPGQTYYVNVRNAVSIDGKPVRPLIDSCGLLSGDSSCPFSITY